MATINWSGVFPAVTTKFTADEEIDFAAFGKNINAQLDAGVDGIILGGTLGESSVLTNDEKAELVKFTGKNTTPIDCCHINYLDSSFILQEQN